MQNYMISDSDTLLVKLVTQYDICEKYLQPITVLKYNYYNRNCSSKVESLLYIVSYNWIQVSLKTETILNTALYIYK